MTHGAGRSDEVTMLNPYEDRLIHELDKLKNLLVAKHNDYGSDNLTKHGIFGILVRLSDKLARLENLIEKDEWDRLVDDESIDDTLLDLAGYAIQALVLKEKLGMK